MKTFKILNGKDALEKAQEVVHKAVVREYDITHPALHRPGPESADSSAMNAEQARMDAALESMNGQVEDVTSRADWSPADAFLRPTGGHGQRPMKTYEFFAPDAWLPSSPVNQNFATPSGTGVAAPEDFRAPKPGPKRAGDGYVLKSATSFADVLLGPEPVEKAERTEVTKGERPVFGPSRWHR
jgi:hypothetical protein